MSMGPDILRLSIPSGRLPNGIFSVSEDGDFLIGFKDAIGIYSPRYRIEPFDRLVYNRMDFFLPSSRPRKVMLRPAVDQIKINDQPELKDFCRHALSVCDRTIVAAESKPRDFKDYVRFSFRAASWSPSGMDQLGRCVFSCITAAHQLLLCGKSSDGWQSMVDVSGIWYECWHHHGLDMLADPQPGLKTLVDELCPQSQTDPAKFAEITYCPSVEEYFSGVLDTSFMQTSWSQRLREVQLGSGETTQGALFAALHRSGTLTFWDVQAPLVSWRNVRLLAINRTYFQTYNPPDFPAKPNFLKIVDFSDLNFMLVLGFTDGKVLGVYHGAYCVEYGKLGLTMINELVLCKSTEFITCQDACYAPERGILCLAYGPRVVVCQINVIVESGIVSLSSSRVVHSEGIIKPISGVSIVKGKLYFASMDGHLSYTTFMSSNRVVSEAKHIIAPSPNSMTFHRNLSGLFVSSNSIHVVFLEIARAPTFSNVASFLTFVSLFKAAELVNFLMRSGDEPLHRQLDSIQELHRRLLTTEPAVKAPSTDAPDSFVLRPFHFLLDQLLSGESVDYSRMSVGKLQLRRAEFSLFLRAPLTTPDLLKEIKMTLEKVDCILALRQMEKCFRLFAKPDIQRQASDCLMALRQAHLCVGYLESPEVRRHCSTALIESLKRLAEGIKILATNLYLRRFGKTESELGSASRLLCSVCTESIRPSPFSSLCSNGHELPRCSDCFEPCTDTSFFECSECKRTAIMTCNLARRSQWRTAISSRFCPFCDIPRVPVYF
ncbi:hypothetical protein AAHC03_024520 [Spirometra sp. Aus1]